MPRLIGPELALKFIVEGAPVPANKAASIGIIDEIIHGDLRAGAVAFARKGLNEKRPLRKVSALAVGDPSVTAAAVAVGDYTLGETGPATYSAGEWVCSGASVTAGVLTLADVSARVRD